jgi:hypothetical protein
MSSATASSCRHSRESAINPVNQYVSSFAGRI